jgi:5'-3' exonuclease
VACATASAFCGLQVAFAPGAPFLPFEQLLAVLPAASCRLLPQPFEVPVCCDAGSVAVCRAGMRNGTFCSQQA